MLVVSPDFVKGKKVLLRLDTDVPIEDGKVVEDLRLKAGLATLDLCLAHAESVVIMGHVGRPKGEDPKYSIKPVVEWFETRYEHIELSEGRLHILENLRFDEGEEKCSEDFASELAEYGDVFINESFAAYHKSASTTVLPTLLPHAAGLQFAKEVETLTKLRNSPKRPNLAIIGGAKVEDKYQSVIALSKICDKVLVGGLLPKEIKEKGLYVPANVVLGKISENGIDLSFDSIDLFIEEIKKSQQVIWGGPVGKYEDPAGNKGNERLAEAIIESGVESIVGGGDVTSAVSNFLPKFTFVSTGGGAMLELIIDGTLPTIEALI